MKIRDEDWLLYYRKSKYSAVTKLAFKKWEMGQPGQMGMVATPKCKEGAYWAHRERKKFGGSDQKCFDYLVFYVGYNVSNVFYGAIKAAKGVWALATTENLIIA